MANDIDRLFVHKISFVFFYKRFCYTILFFKVDNVDKL